MLTGYTLEHALGTSQMATVYRAKQEATGKTLALKIIAPLYSKNPIFREQFLYLLQQWPRLQHPHLMSILDAGVVDDQCYLALPYLPGHSLKQRLRIGYPVERCLEMAQQLASVLGIVHSHHWVHGGVRSHNLYYDENSHLVLAEPDIARQVCQHIGLPLAPDVNTATYISPEQAQGRKLEAASDFYGMGIVLYELLQKRPPFVTETAAELLRQQAEDPPPPLAGRVAYLQPIINQLLYKNPDLRLQQYEHLASLFQQLQTEPKPLTRTNEAPNTSRHNRPKKRPYPAIAAAGLAAGIGIAAWLFLNGTPPTKDMPPTPVPQAVLPQTATESALEPLLLKAERQMNAQLLIAPTDNNAYQTYQHILRLEQNHPQAQQGLEKIAQYLLDIATRQKTNGSWYDSLETLEQALTHFPDHPALLTLKQTVEQAIHEAETQNASTSSPLAIPNPQPTPAPESTPPITPQMVEKPAPEKTAHPTPAVLPKTPVVKPEPKKPAPQATSKPKAPTPPVVTAPKPQPAPIISPIVNKPPESPPQPVASPPPAQAEVSPEPTQPQPPTPTEKPKIRVFGTF